MPGVKVVIFCPVAGCTERKDRWGPNSYRVPALSKLMLPLKLGLSELPLAHSTHMCQGCYKRDRALSRGMVEKKKAEEEEEVKEEVEHSVKPLQSDLPSPHTTAAPHFTVTPISLGLPPPPFTSYPVVLASLYPTVPTPWTGLTVWLLPLEEFPLTTIASLRPPYFHLLRRVTDAKYTIDAVAFNLTATIEGLLPPHPSPSPLKKGKQSKKRKQSNQQSAQRIPQTSANASAPVLEDVLALMKQVHDRVAGEPTRVLYQKDIESFSAWAWMWLGGRKKKKRSVGEFVQVRSPFNPHLFHLHPHNLCSLMADLHFAGFSSPSWYVKTRGSFFCMHVEQIFAPFYNLCYEGGTRWWVVQRDSKAALHVYMLWRVRRWFGVADDEVLTDVEEEAVKGFLLTKQVVFHPDEMRVHGVQLTEVLQSERMVVMGDGDAVHFGTVANTPASSQPAGAQQTRDSVNEAVNVLPLQWLTTGLPLLVDSLRWLRDNWLPMQQHDPQLEGGRATLRLAFRQWRTNELVAHHYAPHWCHALLVRLQELLSIAVPPVDCPYTDTWLAVHRHLEADGAQATVTVAKRVGEALQLMDGGKVKLWLLSHCFMPNKQVSEIEYVSA